MKKIIYLIIIILSSAWFIACDDVNYMHEKYLVDGERFYIGKPDSFKIYGGKNRAKLIVWIPDYRANQLIVSRADTNLVYKLLLNSVNRKDSMVFIIDKLNEGNNILSWYTANQDSSVFSIKGGTSVTTWGSKYESFLTNRKVVSSKFNLLTRAFTITWDPANAKEPILSKYAIGHEIKYLTASANDTVVNEIYASQTTPATVSILKNFPKTGGTFSYRMMFMPVETCIDTFRTVYTDIVP